MEEMTAEIVQELQQRVLAHEPVSEEELRRAIAYLRKSRNAAPKEKAPPKEKKSKTQAADLLSLIEDLREA